MAEGKFRLVETHAGVASWPAAVSGLRMEHTVSVKRKTEQNWMTLIAMRVHWTTLFSLGQRLSDPLSLIKSCDSSVQDGILEQRAFTSSPSALQTLGVCAQCPFPWRLHKTPLLTKQIAITATTNSHYWLNSHYWHSNHYWHNKHPLLMQQTPITDTTNSHYWHNK